MKTYLIPLLAATALFSGCKPSSTNAAYEKFKADVVAQCKSDFKTLFNAELNDEKITVINSKDLSNWIEKSHWKDKELPCEIKEMIAMDRGNIDPSPIALDVSASQEGSSIMYVPVQSKVNCPSPKKGFFLEDDDCVQVMFCHGEIGGECYCICRFPCDSEENLCGICPDE